MAPRIALVSRCDPVPGAVAPFVLREQSGAIDPVAWDRFVIACGGSFLGSFKVIRAERFLHRVRVFELQTALPAGVETIGRCAVTVSGRHNAAAPTTISTTPTTAPAKGIRGIPSATRARSTS